MASPKILKKAVAPAANANPDGAENTPATPAVEMAEETHEKKRTLAKKAKTAKEKIEEKGDVTMNGEETIKATEKVEDEKVFAESKIAATRKNGSAITNYANTQEKVLTISGEERVSNAVDEYGKSLIDLSMSKSNKILLRDKIDSVVKKNHVPLAILYHGPFKVYIPANKLVQELDKPIPGLSLEDSYLYIIQSRLGAEIEYICEDFTTGTDYDENYAIGNHLAACDAYMKRFYLDINRVDGKPKITVGKVVEARVLAVRKYGVYLNVFGFEKFIYTNNLTYNRIDHASKEFSVDDIIEVMVTKITYETDEKGRNIKVKDVDVSGKECKTNPLKKALENCTPGSLYTGEVNLIDEKAVFVTCTFGGVKATCYCPYPSDSINSGSKVTVRIKDVDTNSLQCWGNIVRVNKL